MVAGGLQTRGWVGREAERRAEVRQGSGKALPTTLVSSHASLLGPLLSRAPFSGQSAYFRPITMATPLTAAPTDVAAPRTLNNCSCVVGWGDLDGEERAGWRGMLGGKCHICNVFRSIGERVAVLTTLCSCSWLEQSW